MKVKLLKKLRQQAHDYVRVVPSIDGCKVQSLNIHSRSWYDMMNGYFSRSDIIDKRRLNAFLQKARTDMFYCLADDLLFSRRCERLSKL